MPYKELRGLLAQVITSWQVIAVSVVIILYFFLVSYVADLYRRPRTPSIPRPPRAPRRRLRFPRRGRAQAEAAEGAAANEDELGLEQD